MWSQGNNTHLVTQRTIDKLYIKPQSHKIIFTFKITARWQIMQVSLLTIAAFYLFFTHFSVCVQERNINNLVLVFSIDMRRTYASSFNFSSLLAITMGFPRRDDTSAGGKMDERRSRTTTYLLIKTTHISWIVWGILASITNAITNPIHLSFSILDRTKTILCI